MRVDYEPLVDWPVRPLGDTASITLGGTPSTQVPSFWGGSIPWMASGEVNLKEVWEVEGRITSQGLASSNATLVQPPTVAVGLAGQGKTRGTVACVHIQLCTNQSIALIKGDEVTAHTRYIFHNLDARYEELRARSSGGGRGGLSRAILAEVPLPLPPLPEQRRIAEILDTIDEAIRRTEQVIAKLRQMKQGLLHDLLTRGIDENGELRDPERRPEQFKDSRLGFIPTTWEVRPMHTVTVAPICYGIVQAGSFRPGGVEVLMIRDLEGDFRTNLHRTSPSIDSAYARSRVVPGDLLLSIKGTIGRVGIVPDHFAGNISRDLARIRFSSSVSPSFARQYCLSPTGQHRLALAVVGTTRAEISIHVLKELPFPVPPVAEQELIAQSLSRAEARVRAEEQGLQKLREVKRGLMGDLLTGRVRVPVLEEVPA